MITNFRIFATITLLFITGHFSNLNGQITPETISDSISILQYQHQAEALGIGEGILYAGDKPAFTLAYIGGLILPIGIISIPIQYAFPITNYSVDKFQKKDIRFQKELNKQEIDSLCKVFNNPQYKIGYIKGLEQKRRIKTLEGGACGVLTLAAIYYFLFAITLGLGQGD